MNINQQMFDNLVKEASDRRRDCIRYRNAITLHRLATQNDGYEILKEDSDLYEVLNQTKDVTKPGEG